MVKFQVRKEKLGDRITALQQLVSPFGKVFVYTYLLKIFSLVNLFLRMLKNLFQLVFYFTD